MCPECRSYCCHFHLRSCFTFLFHRFFVSHHSRCDPAFASECLGNVMPVRLLFVISGILAGGIPGFRIELCCFVHPLIWPLVFLSCFGSSVSCGLLAPDTWKCKRAQVRLKATIDIPMLAQSSNKIVMGFWKTPTCQQDGHYTSMVPSGNVVFIDLQHSRFFSRPTPSWLPPGRYTRSIIAKDELRYTCKAVKC